MVNVLGLLKERGFLLEQFFLFANKQRSNIFLNTEN